MAHPDDLKKSNELLEAHFAGKTEYYRCEARMRHKNGEWVWVLDQGKVFEWDEDRKPLRMAGTHLDITERKRAEEELKKHRDHLEELVEERTVELKAANLKLRAEITERKRAEEERDKHQRQIKALLEELMFFSGR